MKFAGKPVYNNLVANLLIYHCPNFMTFGWVVCKKMKMKFARSCCVVLALWIFQDSQQTLPVSAYFGWESFWYV